MTQIGRFALFLALGSATWSAVTGFIGARRGLRAATRTAEGGLRAATVALSVAAFALFYALVTRDFSIEYVAAYTSRSLSLFYTLGAFWAGQAGSLLLWAWMLALYGALVMHQNRTRNRDLMEYGIEYQSVVDENEEVNRAYGVTGFPESFFIDADGEIIAKYVGPMDERTLDAYVSLIVDGSRSGG